MTTLSFVAAIEIPNSYVCVPYSVGVCVRVCVYACHIRPNAEISRKRWIDIKFSCTRVYKCRGRTTLLLHNHTRCSYRHETQQGNTGRGVYKNMFQINCVHSEGL